MKLTLYRVAHDASDARVGTLEVKDGRLASEPPELAHKFGQAEVFHGKRVTPSDGDRYLEALYLKLGRSSYLRAERD